MNKQHAAGPGKAPARGKKAGSASAPAFKEKPGFPGAELPGKAQPPGRSAGVRAVRHYAHSKGI